MTAVHSFLWRGKAYLLADRAITGAGGELLGTMCKFVMGNGTVPWAASFSGHGFTIPEFTARLATRPCDAPWSLSASMAETLKVMTAERPDAVIGVQAAIWSRREKAPVLFVISNSDICFPGLAKAFEPVSVRVMVTGTKPPAELLSRSINWDDDRSFDPRSEGLGIIKAQRSAEKFDRAYEIPAYRIGGGVEVAIVGRHGVRFETLWVWPDKLGELIDPAEQGFPFDLRDQRCAALCSVSA